MKLTYKITGIKNRAFNCLTVSNLKLADVFSDVFGKSSHSIINYILDHPSETFDVTSFINKHCKHSIEEIQTAVDGAVSREQALKLKICRGYLLTNRKNISGYIISDNLIKPQFGQCLYPFWSPFLGDLVFYVLFSF